MARQRENIILPQIYPKTMEQQSFLNELKTNIENRCALWRVGWLGKLLCSPVFWIEAFFVLSVLWGYSKYYTLPSDTYSYYSFSSNLFRGETDEYRTPFYPYVIKAITFITREKIQLNYVGGTETRLFTSGEFSIHCLIFLQTLIMGASLYILYYSAKPIIKSPVLLFSTVLFTGIGLSNYPRWISTESLSISFIMIFISLMISYLTKPTNVKAAGISLFSLLLITLRPVFIYVLALLWAFWLMRILFSNSRISAFVGLICILITSGCIFGYCKLNERNHGFFGISQTGTANQISRIICTGFYKVGTDPEINLFIESQNPDASNLMQGDIYRALLKKYSYNQIDQYSKATIRKNLIPYGICCLKGMWWDGYNRYWNLCYLIGMADFFLCIGLWIAFRQIPWLRLGMWGLFYGLIAVIYINTTCDYERLCSPCLPALYIIIARYIDMLVCASAKPREEFIQYMKSTL